MLHTFSLKTTQADNQDSYELEVQKPDSINDPAWDDLVSDPDADVNELAFQNWVIKFQNNHRDCESRAELENALETYRYNGGPRSKKLNEDDVEEGEFTEKQMQILKRKGLV